MFMNKFSSRILSSVTRPFSINSKRTMLTPFLESKRPKQSPEYDYSTLSNYKSFQIHHTTLNFSLSFEKSVVGGNVLFDLSTLNNSVNEIDLDTSFLDIKKVTIDGKDAGFNVEARKQPLGSKLVIKTDLEANKKFQLQVEFSTTKDCTALQWLTPQQTSGDKPYMFSQLEAIHARSLFPCFDTPSYKSTFTANIESPLPVVFSGIATGATEKEGTSIYHFKQEIPIPAYLVGIASGDLVSAPIGPRSHVYSEPHRLKDCVWEFSGDVEKFIKTAENLIFDYEWGTYDILINVDSYPYGGMESPNMTFATPTLIAHDKTNIDVIAHELAHSWSGNLVTNCSWNHFWLNEGWTVYIERRIVGALHGEPSRHFSAMIGWSDLENSINAMKNPEKFSTLVQKLNDGTDPDDAFSTVPYEKGFNLLFHLENVLGGPAEFDPFIKHYFKKFARQSLDTFQFLDTLFEFYPNKRDVLENVDWERWLFTPGMPPKPLFITTLADNVLSLVKKWVSSVKELKSSDDFKKAFSVADVKDFNSNQIVLFLEELVAQSCVPESSRINWADYATASSTLLDIYKKQILESQNAEVVFKNYKFQTTARIQPSYQQLADWLGTVGRMKFVRPGYRLLNAVDRELAIRTFEKFKDTYHPICKQLVKQDLEL
ncbi:bifunctional aminopeptidase/epoxide hydrolase [Nakaseomyces bracarensis]|uniref:bifunctional aminopeptidase/epoxide hydrolase n=1 Tax=Nakaseomyces bracarensis TaxID=273131 RepID=UPI0038719812